MTFHRDKEDAAPVFRPETHRLISLGLLTIFAGGIRFLNLSHPCLWYDESMVFRRTCGTYGQLLDCLRTDGFGPLHYSLVWVLSQFFKPTPFLLRFFPALCGTLMVPGVYFLARQLVTVGTALLAAGFAACSAFLLFYSRDAKMYMDSWLFVTLNCACVLWWFRTGKTTAWLCWIASGCAACGIHMLSAIPLVISSLLLFTQRTMRWQQAVLWVIGMIVIFAGPIGYYEKFNRWEDRVNEDGWRDSGLTWIADYNQGRTGPQLIRFLGTTMLMGWEWPKETDAQSIPPARVDWPARAAGVILVFLMMGSLPWPTRWRPNDSLQTPVLRYSEEPDLPALQSNPALRHTSEPASFREPQWRVALWLSLWIVIPVYGFYCRSMPEFAAPLDAWNWLIGSYPLLTHAWVWILLLLLSLTGFGVMLLHPPARPMAFCTIALLIVFAAIIGICQLMAGVMMRQSQAADDAGKPWESIWVPRYMGFIFPMLCVAIASLLMRLPTRWVRVFAITFLLGLNLGVGAFRIFGQTEPPVDRMAADAFEAEDPAHHTLTSTCLLPSRDSPGGANLYGEPGQYYLQLLENKPMDPEQFRISIRKRRISSPSGRPLRWARVPADVDRVNIWMQYRPDDKPIATQPAPPPDWKLQSDEWFSARDCWIWQDLAKYRRIVYTKVAS